MRSLWGFRIMSPILLMHRCPGAALFAAHGAYERITTRLWFRFLYAAECAEDDFRPFIPAFDNVLFPLYCFVKGNVPDDPAPLGNISSTEVFDEFPDVILESVLIASSISLIMIQWIRFEMKERRL